MSSSCGTFVPMNDIDISNLPKNEVLAALHNGTCAMGMGMLHDIGRDMTADEAAKVLGWGDDISRMVDQDGTHIAPANYNSDKRLYFDYVQGRPLKSDITGDRWDPSLYDRDAGNGRGYSVIVALREKLGIPE